MESITPSATHESWSSPTTELKPSKNYAIGIALLLAVVLLWTSSNFMIQHLFEGGYEKPFLVTYINTSSFAFYLLPYFIRKKFRRCFRDGGLQMSRGEEYQSLLRNESDVVEDISLPRDVFTIPEARLPAGDPLTTRETARLAMEFCFLWFLSNWSVNAALDFTTVASATVLSSMSGLFTLIVGRMFRVEPLTFWKIGAVVTSFVGVLLVSLSDSSKPRVLWLSSQTAFEVSQPLVGDTLALLSAVLYAFYVTLLKVRIRNESRIDMQLFFGLLGSFNIIACWPIGLLLHFIGIEKFEIPRTRSVIAVFLVNIIITLASDYLYVLSMLKTTPLVVTVGLSLTIPLAVIGDFFMGRPAREPVLLGAILVVTSFIVIGVENAKLRENTSDETRASDRRGGIIRMADDSS